MTITTQEIIQSAQKVIAMEATALKNLSEQISDDFVKAIELILQSTGRIVITGMGKSGHIAGKIAATLASTGTPSFFVHPAELAHGDFGMLVKDDIVIAISQSGETAEITNILIPIKRRGLKLIGISSNTNSTLAEYSDIMLGLGVIEEACPLNLAPTTSTTATLALGDALAITLMIQRKFSKEDFAQFHPGGALGRKLIKVSDIMRKDTNLIPQVKQESTYFEVLEEITNKKLGFTCVLNAQKALIGLITDGDLRRAQIQFIKDIYEKKAFEIMNKNPKVISENALAWEALKIMEDHRISDLLIISSDNEPIGVIDLKDLLKVGIY